jgi:hypothetical protein
MEWLDRYLNYPGLEIWKLLDLAIFVIVAIYILKKPIAQALASRRETIRKQILEAEQERDRAAERNWRWQKRGWLVLIMKSRALESWLAKKLTSSVNAKVLPLSRRSKG